MTSSNHASQHHPIVFDEFFEHGLAEDASPFLKPKARKWAENLELRTSLFSALLLALAYALHWFDHTAALSSLLLVGVYFFAGIPSLIDSIDDIMTLEINIDVLMTLAAFSSVLIGSPMEGALLLVLFSISESMEDAVAAKAKGAISSLYKLSPTTAWVMNEEGKIAERSVKDIVVGDKILVKAGEVVPLDGVVIDGISSVNLVHLTGENLPVTKKLGDDVPAGGKNLEGSLTLEVIHTSGDSTISKIIELVTQAQESRPKLQRWFDSMSKRYASTIILLSVFFALMLPLIAGISLFGVEGSIYRSVAFLIAASPCALIIATPIAYLSAVSICAKKGILIKGGVTLDALASCSAIAFDKTGTLTTGKLRLEEAAPLDDSSLDLDTALSIAASLEKRAVHPIAQAIVDEVYKKNTPTAPIKNFKNIPGYGVEGTAQVNQTELQAYVGNPEYILPKLSDAQAQDLQKKVETIRASGNLVAIMLLGEHLYTFSFTDTLRPGLKKTMSSLQSQKKWRLFMLTGDHKNNAKKIADELGMDEYYADLKPEDKLRHVGQLAEKLGLAMVGDGVNDAPALARATVGICMGKVGSATAAEAADVILLHDNLETLDWLTALSTKTQRIVTQNLTLAAAVILLATTPTLLGWIPLWLAVILHEGGTVLVGLNALRLLK